MKPKTIWVHAGYHKTGTTSIQYACSKLDLPNFTYPLAGRAFIDRVAIGHHLLPWALRRRQDVLSFFPEPHRPAPEVFESVWAALGREIAAARDNVILSSEEFDTLDDAQIFELSKLLSEYRVRPILFIRNYADLMESTYRTHVIHYGETADIGTFVRNSATRLNLPEVLRAWLRIADEGRMAIVNYEDPEVRRDSVAAFADVVGMSLMPGSRIRQNESDLAFVCELVRDLQARGAPRYVVSQRLEQMRRQKYAPSASGYTLLPQQVRFELDAQFARDIEEILSDSTLRPLLRGKLRPFKRSSVLKVINGTWDAQQALVREMVRPAAHRLTPSPLQGSKT